ncbi:MAG: Gx transporter family protein [Lachnospiraceae bacterium]|nr:Gx transporter family protein [Lachnospiraceae bacterium]
MHSFTEDKTAQESGTAEHSENIPPVSGGGKSDVGRTAYMGLLLALALILSYVETLIPFQTGIPGIKLGLANLAVVLCLYLFDWKKTILLAAVKAFLSGFLFGNLFMIVYSFAGAWFSAFFMILLKKSRWFHVLTVSAAGGVMHNMGQLLVAALVVETYGVVYYMPVLIISGLLTGGVIGIVASLVLPYIENVFGKGVS